jgi:hypothetical protein
MTVEEIGSALVAYCQRGEFPTAMRTLYHADIESVEGNGTTFPNARVRGVDACLQKGEEWRAGHDVHSVGVVGPFIGDGQFSVLFNMDITQRATGMRIAAQEVAVYRVANGKIVAENFMMMPMA